MDPLATGTTEYADVSLLVYLEPLVRGRRTLVVGEGQAIGDHLAAWGRAVPWFDEATKRGLERKNRNGGDRTTRARVISVDAAELTELGRPRDGFDVVIVPRMERLVTREGIEQLASLLTDEGVLVTAMEARGPIGYEALYELLSARFAAVRMLGQAPFVGYSVADFSPDGRAPEVMVDGSLLSETKAPPVRYVAICAQSEKPIDAYAVIQVPEAAVQLGTPSPEVPLEVSEDVERLETALRDQGRALSDAQGEVERRATLVRDLVEQLKLGSEGTEILDPAVLDRALGRAVEAEAARAELAFRVDELEGRLRSAPGKDAALTIDEVVRARAELDGTLLGARSRIAELEEMREIAEGRFSLARFELEAERKRQETIDPKMGHLASDALAGECAGLRARLADAEASLVALAGVSLPAELVAEEGPNNLHYEIAMLRDTESSLMLRLIELEEKTASERSRAADLVSTLAARDALVARLQLDLADEERSSREVFEQRKQLGGENARLRQALVDASSAVDRGDALLAEVAGLEVSSSRLQRERDDAHDALVEAREILRELDEQAAVPSQALAEITAVGAHPAALGRESVDSMDRPVSGDGEDPTGDLRSKVLELAGYLEAREARIETLEAMLREDELQDANAIRTDLGALEERIAALGQELERERYARRAAESTAGRPRSEPPQSETMRELHQTLGERDAEALLLKGQLEAIEREARLVRNACVQARAELERLLGDVRGELSPGALERLASTVRTLAKF